MNRTLEMHAPRASGQSVTNYCGYIYFAIRRDSSTRTTLEYPMKIIFRSPLGRARTSLYIIPWVRGLGCFEMRVYIYGCRCTRYETRRGYSGFVENMIDCIFYTYCRLLWSNVLYTFVPIIVRSCQFDFQIC